MPVVMERQIRILLAVAAAVTLGVVAQAPVAGVVRFEPTPEPIRQPWDAEVPVDVAWAGVSMRIPSTWTVSIKPEPATSDVSGASLLATLGPGDSVCLLSMYDPGTVETWQDVGVRAAAELTIGGHRAERFDDMLGTGAAISSAYNVHTSDLMYSLLCHADQAPADRWLSLAETLSFPD